jgi:nucleoside-diphosphate-sugar epimerase
MSNRKTCDVLVCGAGGFIGGWLVAGLRSAGGLSIRAVDIKPLEQWYQRFEDVENLTLDLQDRAACERAVVSGVRMCQHFTEDFGLHTCIARYHNVYGPHGAFDGGREKAPAAICRKIISAKLSGKHEIEIWGDGNQTRSFMYIDDCIKGTRLMVERDIRGPLNIGSNELVSINQLVDVVEEIAGVRLKRIYNLRAPKGVKGRNSNNTRIQKILGWQPSISLREGMEKTYRWIYDKMSAER